MSYHWENTIWQSKDGSWNRGYFKRISYFDHPGAWNDPDYGYDSEWDDDFDHSDFDCLMTGFKTEKDAEGYTPHGNPGSCFLIPYKGNSKECKELDQLAFFHKNPVEREKFERKELLRKNREHFKALASEWTPEKMKNLSKTFKTVSVEIKADEAAYTSLGLTSIFRGYAKVDGDWLIVEGKRVYNLKTNKFEQHVRSLRLG